MSTDKHTILDRVGYAWWMFRASHDLLQNMREDPNPVRKRIVENALVESRAMNGRLLIEFFYWPKSHEDSDMRVGDVLPRSASRERAEFQRGNCPAALKTWKERADKLGAHATVPTGAPRAWDDAPQVHRILADQIQRMRDAVGSDMPDPWNGNDVTAILHVEAEEPNLSAVHAAMGPASSFTSSATASLTFASVPRRTKKRDDDKEG
jgi:hypothetical protein